MIHEFPKSIPHHESYLDWAKIRFEKRYKLRKYPLSKYFSLKAFSMATGIPYVHTWKFLKKSKSTSAFKIFKKTYVHPQAVMDYMAHNFTEEILNAVPIKDLEASRNMQTPSE